MPGPGEAPGYGTPMGALSGWRYCPRCGAPLVHHDGRVECGVCGFVGYANPVPAVAAFVVDEEDRVLLARRAVEPHAGKWDSPGGFLEEGEEPADALHRELREEAAIEVEIERFLGMFLDRYGGDDQSVSVLNLLWQARIAGGEPTPDDDVSELRWFARGALPPDEEIAFTWLAPALRDWATGRIDPTNAESPANRAFD